MNAKFKTINVSPADFATFRKMVRARGWVTAKNGFAQLLRELAGRKLSEGNQRRLDAINKM